VLKAAGDLGIGVAARSGVELAGQDYKSRAMAKELIERARWQGRLEASLALESVERPDLAPEHLAAVIERLSAAAGQIALAGAVERGGGAPGWLLEARPELVPLAGRLEAAAKAGASDDSRNGSGAAAHTDERRRCR